MENGDRGTASHFRQYCSVGILTVAMLLSITSVTYAASNFYWYGENDSTCWQTGQPGSPGKACSTVGAGYLATPGGHTGGLAYMSEGGVATDLATLSSSGDYCSYYRLGDQLTSQDSTNEGSISGISMPTPYSSYQEGDKSSSAWNACQADGSYWGQAVRGPAGGGCSGTCGIHHYVSFRSQGTNDRPWSTAFGEPSLVLSAEAGVYTFSHTGANYRGWGYVCPELEDTSFHGVLEYCFQEWRSANDPPEWKNERRGECGSSYGQVNTFFWPSTTYATEMPGSTNTFEVGSTGSGHFEAKITEANLKSAARLINAECAGWHLSENPANYALVGVEQGLEGEAGVTTLGGWSANLQLRTEYTPVSATPFAFREPKTGNQDVFFRGADNALWQDAWTATNGWKLYRIGGTLTSDPMGYIEPNETMNIFYRGANNAIWQYYRSTTGAWTTQELGGSSAGKPYGYMQPSGYQNVFYRGTNNEIWQLWYDPSTGWHNIPLGGTPAGGDPTAYLEPNGNQNVFYRTTEGTIGQLWWTEATGWHDSPLGGSAVGTPTALVQPNGNQNVFYRTPEGTMGQWWWQAATGWHNTPLGGSVIGNPFGFISSNGQHIYYRNNYGTIGEWWWEEATGWHNRELGEGASGDPTGFAQPNGDINVYFFEAGTGALDQWFNNGTWNLSTVCPGPCG